MPEKQQQFFVIYTWMSEDLGLTWPELAVYAVVYGFTKNGSGVFNASAETLGKWIGCERKTVLRAMQRLCEKGLLSKTTRAKGAVPNQYIINSTTQVQYPDGTVDSTTEVPYQYQRGTVNSTTEVLNNKDYNKPYSKLESKAHSVRHRHGEYKNVLLTEQELQTLQREIPDTDALIQELSGYLASTGKSYKSHYATLRNWARRRSTPAPASPRAAPGRGGTPVLTDEDYLKGLPDWAVIDRGIQ